MATKFQSEIKKFFEEESQVFADKITCSPFGVMKFDRGFFYTMGGTSQSWADKVKAEFDRMGYTCDVAGEENRGRTNYGNFWRATVSNIQKKVEEVKAPVEEEGMSIQDQEIINDREDAEEVQRAQGTWGELPNGDQSRWGELPSLSDK